MPVDITTPNRNYPLPFKENELQDDVARLIGAITGIDRDIANILVSLALKSENGHGHVISDITGLAAALAAKQDADQKGLANGFASLGADGKVPAGQLPSAVLGALSYQGTWNANTNAPTIPAASASNKGWYYKVGTPGPTSVSGIDDWKVGDWVLSNGTGWDKVDNTESVVSVAGLTGAIGAAALLAAIGAATSEQGSKADAALPKAEQALAKANAALPQSGGAIDGALTVRDAVHAGLPGDGRVSLVPGGMNPGYHSFHTPDGVRRGYVGWADGSYGALVGENGWGWRVPVGTEFRMSGHLRVEGTVSFDNPVTLPAGSRIGVDLIAGVSAATSRWQLDHPVGHTVLVSSPDARWRYLTATIREVGETGYSDSSGGSALSGVYRSRASVRNTTLYERSA